jgi:hypothetical protein
MDMDIRNNFEYNDMSCSNKQKNLKIAKHFDNFGKKSHYSMVFLHSDPITWQLPAPEL